MRAFSPGHVSTALPLAYRPALPAPLGWYGFCAAYLATPEPGRPRVSKQTRATYARIKRLPRTWGEALDLRAAPLLVLRWIAWGRDEEERERRFAEAMAAFEEGGKWPRCSRGKVRGAAAERG